MNDPATPQDAVFAFLAAPKTHGGQSVRRIDTHAAVVFLAGDRALKVKRAVRFPFLDYSTLAKRHAACRAELDVNRPFAPELYLGVVPITRTAGGGLHIGGDGEPVEWAVEMRRFDESRTLDRLAEDGKLDDALADEIARAVATMHARAAAMDAAAWLGKVDEILAQNARAFAEFPELFAADAVAKLDRDARSAFARLRPLLEERGRSGLVRRGHGDLHLGNIALIDGKPLPFDAIEFDPLIAAGDVFYDLAFLLMDLVERNLKGPANIVLNRYLLASGRPEDVRGLAALPLFMSLRAAIRAKVTAAQLQHVEGPERDKRRRACQVYFDLAGRLLVPVKPTLVAVGGLSGTGKSVLARALAPDVAPEPGAVIARSDIERKLLFGVDETERLPPDAYRSDVNRKVYERITDKAHTVLAAGHSAVADAVFGRAEERTAIAAVAGEANARFCGLFLVADLEIRLKRVGGRIADASDADVVVARQQEQHALGDLDWIQIDASGTVADTLKLARAALQRSPGEKGNG
jgi:aminoglycoside phosphotransferase family enzyme/predicted kinase